VNLLFPAIVLVASAICLWKADDIGCSLKQLDGGKLQRGTHNLGSDARTYPFAVRLMSIALGAISLWGLIGQLVYGL